MTCFVLIHSPLVGPTTWRWVAEELRSRGDEVLVPALDPAVVDGGWRDVVTALASQVSDAHHAVFVAHSGAGPLLPGIVQEAHVADPTMVFVDAGLPSTTSATPLMPAEILADLASLAVGGVLPPWSSWFGDDAMAQLVPDVSRRHLVEEELPTLPLDYFCGAVAPVVPWPSARNGYVLLSGPYEADAAEARRRGWPVAERGGRHLDLVSDAPGVASSIRLVAQSN